MSNLTQVSAQGQLRGQEQPQRQGQAQIKRTPQHPGQPGGQGQAQGPDKSHSFHSNGIDRRFERLLVTARRDGKTVKCIETSNIGQQSAERPLGRGAFGEVWAVVDPRSGQSVALKRLANIFSSRQFAIRVFREITCLTALQHENILGALDVLQVPSIDQFQDVFVLTQLMDSDLYRIIISNQRLSITHIKIFLYQILRGLKYLHSGKIIHRDIKPANLLVNSDCSLKICDFGLVRDDDVTSAMTQDVSTQYYRAPEMLMGAKNYMTSVDMWAVGCVFAELLSRRILFQANSPIQQLDLIMEVVGTPLMDDMKYACEAARKYILRQAPRKPEANSQILQSLSSPDFCSQDAVQLLRRLLVFNPEKRLTASKALQSVYVRQGRECYHSTICACHPSRAFHPRSMASMQDDPLSSFPDPSNELEPIIQFPFSFQLQQLEEDLESPPSLTTIRTELYRLCLEKQKDQTNPLRINTRSPAYRQFIEDQPQFKN